MNTSKSLCALLVTVGLAQAGAARFSMGGAASVFHSIKGKKLGIDSEHVLYSNLGQPIPVKVKDIYQDDEALSMNGQASGSDGSEFIFKGTPGDLYGWVVLRKQNLAYEYTTDENGGLVVEEVPVTKIFPDCDLPEDPQGVEDLGPVSASASDVDGPEPHIGPYPGTPVNKFQSKPGAPKVLYWDISQAPNLWTPAQMWEAWQTFAATMSMFDVNVTTDPAVWNATPVLNRGRSFQHATSGTSSCGLRSFGTSTACTIYKKSSPAYQGGTLGHEVGHQLGLSHDGTTSTGYFSGFSTFKWTPMMGAHATAIKYAGTALLQYSKGEYTSANQKQDDFALITGAQRGLSFRAKTHVGIKPLKLTATSEVKALENRGQIVKNTDKDIWSFSMKSGGGRAVLRVDRTERAYGSMLDVEAVILNSSGTQVAKSNVPQARHAEFDLQLPAGDYTLQVKGGAEGTPFNGFSNYSSLGFYAISGTLTGASPTAVAAGDVERGIGVSTSRTSLHLALPASARVEGIRLYNASGKVAFDSRQRVDAIDMTRMQPGLYVLRLTVDGRTVTRNVSWFQGLQG